MTYTRNDICNDICLMTYHDDICDIFTVQMCFDDICDDISWWHMICHCICHWNFWYVITVYVIVICHRDIFFTDVGWTTVITTATRSRFSSSRYRSVSRKFTIERDKQFQKRTNTTDLRPDWAAIFHNKKSSKTWWRQPPLRAASQRDRWFNDVFQRQILNWLLFLF